MRRSQKFRKPIRTPKRERRTEQRRDCSRLWGELWFPQLHGAGWLDRSNLDGVARLVERPVDLHVLAGEVLRLALVVQIIGVASGTELILAAALDDAAGELLARASRSCTRLGRVSLGRTAALRSALAALCGGLRTGLIGGLRSGLG